VEAYGDLLSHDYIDGVTPLTATTLNRLFQLLPEQMQGALTGLGAGIITGLTGSSSGLTYFATAGSAIVAYLQTAAEGLTFVASTTALEVVLPGNKSALWLWLQAAMPEDTDYDARLDGTAFLVYTETATPPANSLPLERGYTYGSSYYLVEDLRVVCPARVAANLGAALALLQAAVGDPYENTDSLDTRVSAIEAQPGGEGSGYEYWDAPGAAMPKAPGDSTTIPQEIDARLTAALADVPTGSTTTVPDPWDVDAVNQALALLQEIADDSATAALTQRDCVVIVPGKWGDSTGGSVDFCDREASTWTTGLTTPA